MKRLLFVAAVVITTSGCSSYKSTYTHKISYEDLVRNLPSSPDGGNRSVDALKKAGSKSAPKETMLEGYWQIIDTSSLTFNEPVTGLLIINGRNACIKGDKDCRIHLGQEQLAYVGDSPVNPSGVVSGGFVGGKAGGVATTFSYEPATNRLIELMHAPYEIYGRAGNIKSAIFEAGDMLVMGYVAKVTNPEVCKTLTAMYEHPELIAGYLEKPTCTTQREVVKAIDAVNLAGPKTSGIEDAIRARFVSGVSPYGGSVLQVPEQEARGHLERLKANPELLWTELEEKGYCSYARDMITGFVNAIVFKEKILGYAGDTYLAIERQYPPQQLLNSFNPWHAHVETNFVMLPVPNEPLANARYTRRDENAVHAVAAMNSWVRNVR
jgi:hypothetical protein